MQIDHMFVFLGSDACMTPRKQSSKITVFIVGCVPTFGSFCSGGNRERFNLEAKNK